jgi:hypothetical protein
LAVRQPLAERKGRPHVFRIDGTSDDEKLVLDAGSAANRDAWIVALGNAGAVVPAAYIDKLDKAAADAARYTATPRQRRFKKGGVMIQASLTHRAATKTVAEWQQHWFEFEVPNLTVHRRPGGEILAEIKMDQLELSVGPSVEAELGGRDFSFKTELREPWDGNSAVIAEFAIEDCGRNERFAPLLCLKTQQNHRKQGPTRMRRNIMTLSRGMESPANLSSTATSGCRLSPPAGLR